MGIFNKRHTAPTGVGTVQLRQGEAHPFSALTEYVPMQAEEMRLYRTIREAVPVIDAAIVKLIRLTGGFTVECADKNAQRALEQFLRTVDVGRGQQGIQTFLDSYLDDLLTCGRAVGEMVLTPQGTFRALLCGDPAKIRMREKDGNPLETELCAADGTGRMQPLPYQQLLLFTPLNPESDHPCGVSLLRSMPFLADILVKIYNTIGVNWERAGNVRFAVTCKNDGSGAAGERAQVLAREWSEAMQSGRNGVVRDFVAVGDVDIRVIGAENQVLDSEVPVRQILEQLVARTGIPPFMLGLSWSTTERMSAEQADVLSAEIAALRRTLEPVIRRVCTMFLALNGWSCTPEIVWDVFSIRDEEAQAHAELYLAQADHYRAQAEHTRAEAESEGGEEYGHCQGGNGGGEQKAVAGGSGGHQQLRP